MASECARPRGFFAPTGPQGARSWGTAPAPCQINDLGSKEFLIANSPLSPVDRSCRCFFDRGSTFNREFESSGGEPIRAHLQRYDDPTLLPVVS